jgi:hypothetical protein
VGCFDENAQYSESAWTIHASCKGQIALSKEPLQEWRIHGDNYSWPNELETHDIVTRQLDNEIMAGANLLKTFNTEEDEWHRRGEVIRRYYSDLLFSKAYHLRGRQIKEGLKALYRSFLLAPRLSHVKLALTFLLPQWRGRGAGEAPGG